MSLIGQVLEEDPYALADLSILDPLSCILESLVLTCGALNWLHDDPFSLIHLT